MSYELPTWSTHGNNFPEKDNQLTLQGNYTQPYGLF